MKKVIVSSGGAAADEFPCAPSEQTVAAQPARAFPVKSRRRKRLSRFLLSLSAAIARVDTADIDRQLDFWLGKLARFIEVDRIALWEFVEVEQKVRCWFSWAGPAASEAGPGVSSDTFSWLIQKFSRGRTVVWQRIPDDIPRVAEAERTWAASVGAKSFMGIPRRSESRIWVLNFTTCARYASWRPGRVRRLQLVGEVVLGAILRQRAEQSQRRRDENDRALRRAMPDTVFVCTREGVYLEYFCGNAADLLATPHAYLGRRVEEVLGFEIATKLRAAFEKASRDDACVCLEYAVNQHGEPRHYEVRVARRADGAFLCLERDVTEFRQAQAEIGRLCSELIHFERVHLMGHLTASLAHQLMQPITAILSNAEAGFRVLDAKVRDDEALRAILQDVQVCSHNAADVIRGVTDLLHKQPRPSERVSLNRIVQDVIDVMRSDLILRQVGLVTQLSQQDTEVLGDAVRLQQVVLNLFLNALDAMKERDSQQRTLVVTTTTRETEVELRVCDRGTGIDPRYLQEMFKPFFTTKTTGMGMGLHICSEIVRTHGGRMSAQNNRESPGLTVLCVLPLA